MGASQGTGTVRSAVRPPQAASTREKKFEVPYGHVLPRKPLERDQTVSASATFVHESSSKFQYEKDARGQDDDGREENSHDVRFLFCCPSAFCKRIITLIVLKMLNIRYHQAAPEL